MPELLFPFDDVERYPESTKEPASQRLDWKNWLEAQKQFEALTNEGGRIGKGNELLVNEKDVFDMTALQLDEYMDWYEKSWLDVRTSHPLAEMFPAGRTGIEVEPQPISATENQSALEQKLDKVMGALKPRKALSEEEIEGREDDILRPGELYQRYRSESDLPETARAFYEAASKIVGLSLHRLVRTVFETERRLDQWLDDKRRMEYHGEYPETDAGTSVFGVGEDDEEMSELEYLDDRDFSAPEDDDGS
ncbi:hypothetical protein Plec18167_003322 [Paecilomyces lecythidis]|uniref:Rrn7/TAF1B C-terminal cyclin domain-containing protein n=1 Tax=Paecilomyces lecythidis TaxID=3004212 RepID=A0ABR3Y0C2_9EURO